MKTTSMEVVNSLLLTMVMKTMAFLLMMISLILMDSLSKLFYFFSVFLLPMEVNLFLLFHNNSLKVLIFIFFWMIMKNLYKVSNILLSLLAMIILISMMHMMNLLIFI